MLTKEIIINGLLIMTPIFVVLSLIVWEIGAKRILNAKEPYDSENGVKLVMISVVIIMIALMLVITTLFLTTTLS